MSPMPFCCKAARERHTQTRIIGSRRESTARKPGYGKTNPTSWVFYKAAHSRGPAKYKLHQRIQCHRCPEKQHQEKATFLSVDVLLPGHPHAALTHPNLLLPFCHRSYAHFLTCLSTGIKRLLKSLCSKFMFLSSSIVHVGLKEQHCAPHESEKGPRQRKEPKIYYLLPKPISFIWQDLNQNNFDC